MLFSTPSSRARSQLPPARILMWGGIGDALLVTPALRTLKQQAPSRRVIVYGQRREHEQVLRHNPYVDKVHLPDRRARPSFHWIAARTFFWRAVWPRNLLCANYGELRPSLGYTSSATTIIGDLLGVQVTNPKLDLFLTDQERAAGRQALQGYARPVAIHPAAACSPNKLWNPERWAALVASLPELTFVQLGTIRDPLVDGVVDLRGASLRHSFALLANCRALVCVDSALAHAAAALAIPAVVLFGPSTPRIWGHGGTRVNLYAGIPCSPCIDVLAWNPCPYGRRCMEQLSVDAVRTALLETLQ
jgi:ADP-heptose:LPS heptosyltransferase